MIAIAAAAIRIALSTSETIMNVRRDIRSAITPPIGPVTAMAMNRTAW